MKLNIIQKTVNVQHWQIACSPWCNRLSAQKVFQHSMRSCRPYHILINPAVCANCTKAYNQKHTFTYTIYADSRHSSLCSSKVHQSGQQQYLVVRTSNCYILSVRKQIILTMFVSHRTDPVANGSPQIYLMLHFCIQLMVFLMTVNSVSDLLTMLHLQHRLSVCS